MSYSACGVSLGTLSHLTGVLITLFNTIRGRRADGITGISMDNRYIRKGAVRLPQTSLGGWCSCGWNDTLPTWVTAIA